MTGRTFALTGPQMLELAMVLRLAEVAFSRDGRGNTSALAQHWADYLRSEHAAHFGTETEANEQADHRELDRYSPFSRCGCPSPDVDMEQDPDGDWVHREDVAHFGDDGKAVTK